MCAVGGEQLNVGCAFQVVVEVGFHWTHDVILTSILAWCFEVEDNFPIHTILQDILRIVNIISGRPYRAHPSSLFQTCFSFEASFHHSSTALRSSYHSHNHYNNV